MTEAVPIRHGLLIKRSVAKSVTTIKAKFQRRYFKLYPVRKYYYLGAGKRPGLSEKERPVFTLSNDMSPSREGMS